MAAILSRPHCVNTCCLFQASVTRLAGRSGILANFFWLSDWPLHIGIDLYTSGAGKRRMHCLSVGILVAVASFAGILTQHCQVYDESSMYGKFCPISGLQFQSPPGLCIYACLHSDWCVAFSHNATNGTCTMTLEPCPLALPAPGMDNYMFAVFSEKPLAHCFQWVPFNGHEPPDNRMIIVINKVSSVFFILARMKKNNATGLGYEELSTKKCYAHIPTTGPVTTFEEGWICERLRIVNGCTAFWVPYKAGESLPGRAVTGGAMANGDVMYVAHFPRFGISFCGYYTEEGQEARSATWSSVVTSKTMELLVIL